MASRYSGRDTSTSYNARGRRRVSSYDTDSNSSSDSDVSCGSAVDVTARALRTRRKHSANKQRDFHRDQDDLEVGSDTSVSKTQRRKHRRPGDRKVTATSEDISVKNDVLRTQVNELQRTLQKSQRKCRAALHEAARYKLLLEHNARQEVCVIGWLRWMLLYSSPTSHSFNPMCALCIYVLECFRNMCLILVIFFPQTTLLWKSGLLVSAAR
jgi:hypothetical protein